MHLSMECPGLNRCCAPCTSGKRNGRRQKNGDESNFVNANHSYLTFWFDGSKASVLLMETLTALQPLSPVLQPPVLQNTSNRRLDPSQASVPTLLSHFNSARTTLSCITRR